MMTGRWLLLFVMVLAGCGAPRSAASPVSAANADRAAAGGEAVSDHPSVAAVQRGISAVAPAVRACLGAYPDHQVVAEITLAHTGLVDGVVIASPAPPDPDGSPVSEVEVDANTAACMRAALARVEVPPFERESFLVRYPFRGR